MHYNLVNEYMNCKVSSLEPVVGMAATMFVGSDRYAMVITEVISPKKIRVDHMDNSDYNTLNENDKMQNLSKKQMMNYVNVTDKTITPSGDIFSYRKNHRWIKEGQDLWGTGSIHLGHAENYRDPSF